MTPAGLHVSEPLIEDLVEPGPMRFAPGPADARDAVQLGEELLQRGVHDVAAINRCELHDLFGTLDRSGSEEVADEVGVRALRPRLQTRRRHRHIR